MKKNSTLLYEAPAVEIIPVKVENGFSGSNADGPTNEGQYDPIAPEGGDDF